MRSVQHVDCRSAVALALPLLVDRRQANTAAAAVAAVTVNAIATSSFVSVAVQAALVDDAAAAAAT